ncbi:MAG: MoaD/ThiS family protein [Desulfurococcaceae archaeon]
MRIYIKYLLWLSEVFGTKEEIVEVPGETTVAGVLRALIARRPRAESYIRNILSGNSEIIVLHNSMTPVNGLDTVLRDQDTITLIPPVSGG